jgi:hypothetical protein
MAAVSCVVLFTTTESTTIPVPMSTVVAPETKPVPVNTTSSDWRRLATCGAIFVTVGTGLVTVNPSRSVSVPPPGGLLVTKILL